MTAKKLQVGSHLEAYCTKCKEDRDHVVESLKSNGVANKVRCGFCDGSHLFRAPKGAAGAEKPKAAPKSGASKPKSSKDKGVTEAEQAKAKPYAIDREFAQGDVVSHAKFGFGRVMALKAGGKMEVHFEGGSRILLCKDMGSLLFKRSRAVIRPVEVVEVAEEEAEVETEAVPLDDDVDEAAAEEEE